MKGLFVPLLWICGLFYHVTDAFIRLKRTSVDVDYQNIVVNTTHGLVKGIEKVISNKTVDAFFGIPFAKPPVGDLRFKKPVPNDPWNGTYEAIQRPNACQQRRYEVVDTSGEKRFNPNTPVSEDCLYLNLWVPRGVRNATTLIWIYGGGFTEGSSALNIYDGSILASTHDVIIASMNYRLGVFGFLYLGTDDAPGNMGLYDQALAIHWIKNNIEAFGGNPESLTLFGESAGAASVSLHLISPLSGHVIRRGILESGSMNAPWAFMTAEDGKRASRELMNEVGCSSSLLGTDYTAAIKCLTSVENRKLLQAQFLLNFKRGFSVIVLFAPVIDGVVLQKEPIDLLREGKFPKAEIIIGNNQDEGTLFTLFGFPRFFTKENNLTAFSRKDFWNIINTILKDGSISQLYREAISLQYTDWDHVEEDKSLTNAKAINDIFGDYFFVCPSNYFAHQFAEHGSNVYYYRFTHRSSQSRWPRWMGVVHADELAFVFGLPLNPTIKGSFTEDDKNLSSRLMNYFTTFAKMGKPTTDESFSWPNYSRKEFFKYLVLNENATFQVELGPRSKFCALWNEFLPLLKKASV